MAQTIPEEDTKLFHIFGDEACITAHRWMVIGTTVVSDEHLGHVRAKFAAMEKEARLGQEIKWERTSRYTIGAFKKFVRAYCYLIKEDVVNFHCLRLDLTRVNHRKYNQNVPDIGYNKFICQLLLKYPRIYPPERKYHVILDDRGSKLPLRPFQDYMNHQVRNEHGLDHWPYRRLQFQTSHSELLLQINDIFVGAAGFVANRKDRIGPTKDSLKAELAAFIRDELGLPSLRWDNGLSAKRFSIWLFKLPPRERAPKKTKRKGA